MFFKRKRKITMETPRTMITFRKNGSKFTYRIAGIAIHNGHVLFQKGEEHPDDIFYFLPGGRAELGESAEEGLRREILEELGVEGKVERLIYVMENLFKDFHNNEIFPHHEIGFYFLISFPPESYLYRESGPFIRSDEAGNRCVFEWLPIAELPQIRVMPPFFRTGLVELPDGIEHIVEQRVPGA